MRVAAVPSAHPYVQGVRVPGHELLADPPVPGAPAGRWWPPVVLSPEWLRENAGAFDLLHVHFGTESLSLERLAAALEALREVGRPLVYTAHDLEHPHLADQSAHRAQLGLLVGEAAEVLTLTGHAAAQLLRDHGRAATVVPHPRMAPESWFGRADALRRARPSAAPLVGLHLRSLRANVRPGPWIVALAGAVADRGGRLRVLVNDDLAAGGAGSAALADLRRTLGDAPADVVERPRPDDDGLHAELAALDVSVLPYAHGTHSGWLELCWDLGTRVLSPEVGAIADQHREPWAVQTFDAGRSGTVGQALDRLLAAAPPPGAEARLEARRRVAEENRRVHAEVYRRALAGGGGPTPGSSPPAR